MDIQMPVMDGIEATHEILAYEEDEEVAHVPIVALTANALKGDRERFLNEGMDEYITKPIETSELLYVLNKFLSDKSTISSAKKEKKDTQDEKESKTEIIETPVDNEIKIPSLEHNNISLELEEDSASIILEESIDLSPDSLILEEDTLTILDDPVVETKEEEILSKQILIAKKFILERRVLIKVLENIGYSYNSIEQLDTLEHEILSEHYDIIFTDKSLVSDALIDTNNKLSIITDKKSKDEIIELIQNQRGQH